MSVKRIQLDAMHLRSALQEHVGRWSMKELPMALAVGDTVEFRYFTQHLDSGVITRVITPGDGASPDWTAPNKAWWHIEYDRHAFELSIRHTQIVEKMARWENLVIYTRASSDQLIIKFPSEQDANDFTTKYELEVWTLRKIDNG